MSPMTDDYRPIDCSVHDRLEDLAVRHVVCRIRYRMPSEASDPEGTDGAAEKGTEIEGRIVDVFARDGEELLRVDDGREIRLDRLLVVAPA